MNGSHSLRKQLSFRLANRRGESLKLPVDVREADIIKIYERHSSNGGTRQCLGSITANTAQSEDSDVRVQQSTNAIVAHETNQAIPASVNAFGRGR